jgi:hypothetical protein
VALLATAALASAELAKEGRIPGAIFTSATAQF